jgi:hypothetical protein
MYRCVSRETVLEICLIDGRIDYFSFNINMFPFIEEYFMLALCVFLTAAWYACFPIFNEKYLQIRYSAGPD